MISLKLRDQNVHYVYSPLDSIGEDRRPTEVAQNIRLNILEDLHFRTFSQQTLKAIEKFLTASLGLHLTPRLAGFLARRGGLFQINNS